MKNTVYYAILLGLWTFVAVRSFQSGDSLAASLSTLAAALSALMLVKERRALRSAVGIHSPGRKVE